MLYAKITLNVGRTYIQPLDQLGVLLEEICEGAEGDTWTVELVEMTPEVYAALPEFEGH